MQELIDKLESKENEYDEMMKNHNLDQQKCGMIANVYADAARVATELLQKEKDAIIGAFTAGQIDISECVLEEYKKYGLVDKNTPMPRNDKEDGVDYYNQKYIQP